jgi:DNA mismatch repair ATPase MutS
MLLLLPFFPVLFIWLLIPFSINTTLHFWNKKNTFPFLQSLPQLNSLINVSECLCNMDMPFEKERTRQSLSNLKSLQRKVKFIDFGGNGIVDEIKQSIRYFWEIIKALMLLEVHALFAVVRELENKQSDIESLFHFVGARDMAISRASIVHSGHLTCVPQFTVACKKIQAGNIYHPLVTQCVANDISVTGKSVLITGSNMSGKSTFLRTLAVNVLLAQTLYLCFAESYSAPFLTLYSSIRIADNLLEDESYYLKEVAVMASLIESATEDRQSFFILDEVFKGTNTIERIAASKAVLSFLNQKDHLVFVATHDIELSALLDKEFDLYHFEENINNDQLCFDHKLKPGPLTTRNALKILEIASYPKSIIDEAKTIAERL